ncbi:MAG: leucine-rich repeat protein [Clostridia bacterium]|nr:leucine-rich repeat protein [Clostridia bacterium]
MKKICAVLLSVLLLISLFPAVSIAAVVNSGTCGENVTWTLDDQGTLTVKGTGKMNDYISVARPWNNEIRSVVIENGVTSVGANAFTGCALLSSVTLPNSVTQIGYMAFSGCKGLPAFTVPGSVASIGDYCFKDCTGMKTLTIQNGLSQVGKNAFENCKELTSISLPHSLTYTSVGMFQNCSGLENVRIPDSVTTIESNTFYGCESLADVRIPDSVTTIGGSAFGNCKGLTSVLIPKSATTVSMDAFRGCSALTVIEVEDGNPVYHARGNCLINTAEKKVVLGCASSEIPDDGSVTVIGRSAFAKCEQLTSITLSDGLIGIEVSAFSDCKQLKSIDLPESLSVIGDGAFSGCKGLTDITIPGGVTYFGMDAFSECSGLTGLTISEGVKSIPWDAFFNCSGLTEITFPESLVGIGHRSFALCTGLESVTFLNGDTDIDYAPFANQRDDYYGDYYGVLPITVYSHPGGKIEKWANDNKVLFFSLDAATLTLEAPEVVNLPIVDVSGTANAKVEISLSVNGEAAGSVMSDAKGNWTAKVPLKNVKREDVCTVTASSVWNGLSAQESAEVVYRPDPILFKELTATNNGSSFFVSDKTQNAGKRIFTVSPEKPYSFRVKVTNAAFVQELYVVSTKNGEEKKIPLLYNSDDDVWQAEGYFDDGDKTYIPGAITVEGVDLDAQVFDAGLTQPIVFLSGLSGFAYEAVESNVLQDVTASVYAPDGTDAAVLWDAESTDQENPLNAGADGAFAWSVPEGKWQVRLSKEGYENAESAWLDVPPTQNSAAIPMVRAAAPQVNSVNFNAAGADVVFDCYMDIDSVNAETVVFEGYAGTFEPLDKTETKAGSGVFYATSFRFTPDKAFSGTVHVTVSGAKNYAGKENEAFSETAEIAAPAFTPGDVNHDGAIGADDARLALRRSVDLEDYAEGSAEFLVCDVNGDKTVGADDARLILRASVDLEDLTSWG